MLLLGHDIFFFFHKVIACYFKFLHCVMLDNRDFALYLTLVDYTKEGNLAINTLISYPSYLSWSFKITF